MTNARSAKWCGAIWNWKVSLSSEAETGPQALSILQDSRPDLMVLDIMLPGVDGFLDHTPIASNDGLQPFAH